MIGDIVLIKKSDITRGKLIVPDILKLKDKSLITIGGGSGSKKTELAMVLQELLYKKNKQSILISLDDFYKTHFKDRNRIRKQKGIKSVGTREIDWVHIKKIIRLYKRGIKHIPSMPVINKYTGSYNEQMIYNTNEVDYLIVEGLYANYLSKWNLSNYAIHIDGNPEQTLHFRKYRGKENENSEFRKKVVQKEFNVVSQLKRYADRIMEV